ncbi:hypothetical protein DIPPA_10289 [Diplonema papillatum]|nr:hypothetical protein DIPPA_10289 [Diplonema papillatum]
MTGFVALSGLAERIPCRPTREASRQQKRAAAAGACNGRAEARLKEARRVIRAQYAAIKALKADNDRLLAENGRLRRGGADGGDEAADGSAAKPALALSAANSPLFPREATSPQQQQAAASDPSLICKPEQQQQPADPQPELSLRCAPAANSPLFPREATAPQQQQAAASDPSLICKPEQQQQQPADPQPEPSLECAPRLRRLRKAFGSLQVSTAESDLSQKPVRATPARVLPSYKAKNDSFALPSEPETSFRQWVDAERLRRHLARHPALNVPTLANRRRARQPSVLSSSAGLSEVSNAELLALSDPAVPNASFGLTLSVLPPTEDDRESSSAAEYDHDSDDDAMMDWV